MISISHVLASNKQNESIFNSLNLTTCDELSNDEIIEKIILIDKI
jgi:hypothetical protein